MECHITLKDLSPEGLELVIDDPDVWSDPCREFHIPVQVVEALTARVSLLPQDGGCLVRGVLRGTVSMPCDRCAEPALITVNQEFDEFELYPAGAGKNPIHEDQDEDLDSLDSHAVFQGKSGPVLDLGALLWEEFALALPVKPLCSPGCKGICPQCGANFNRDHCDCSRDEGDPRLAALRELSKKNVRKGD